VVDNLLDDSVEVVAPDSVMKSPATAVAPANSEHLVSIYDEDEPIRPGQFSLFARSVGSAIVGTPTERRFLGLPHNVVPTRSAHRGRYAVASLRQPPAQVPFSSLELRLRPPGPSISTRWRAGNSVSLDANQPGVAAIVRLGGPSDWPPQGPRAFGPSHGYCRPEGGECARRCAQALIVYDPAVTALKAHIVNGRIVVDEPVDLPDGAEVQVYLYDASAEAMSAEERAALERALERSLVQADAGELIESDEVLAELQRP
jgi:hypothetical protein